MAGASGGGGRGGLAARTVTLRHGSRKGWHSCGP